MAMTAKLWSISGLATGFGMDLRTVAKRLAAVPHAGELRGSPAWRLADAAAVLADQRTARQAPPVPPGWEWLAGLPAHDAIAGIVATEIAHELPELVRQAAVAGGVAVRELDRGALEGI